MSILVDAYNIINDREAEYGSADKSFNDIAQIWSLILGTKVFGTDVALCMIGLKLVRSTNKITKDSLIDICGYASLVERIEGKTNG